MSALAKTPDNETFGKKSADVQDVSLISCMLRMTFENGLSAAAGDEQGGLHIFKLWNLNASL